MPTLIAMILALTAQHAPPQTCTLSTETYLCDVPTPRVNPHDQRDGEQASSSRVQS